LIKQYEIVLLALNHGKTLSPIFSNVYNVAMLFQAARECTPAVEIIIDDQQPIRGGRHEDTSLQTRPNASRRWCAADVIVGWLLSRIA
jgi:hypothetical protein